MPIFLTPEPPARITMALVEAFDLVDFGIILLSPDLNVRFLNRRLREIWTFDLPNEQRLLPFRELLMQVADQGVYPVSLEERLAFVDAREDEVRNPSGWPRTIDLTDGRRFVITCKVTPEGGRMLTYAEETAWREFETRQQHALEDAQRRDAELRFNTELLESHSAQLAALAETAEATALRAIEANNRLEQEVEERNHLMLELQRMATTDPLTGLTNRGQFMKLANGIVQAGRLHSYPAAVMMLDIDHFKSINDHYGHAVGDAVLQIVSERLNATIRPSDVLGRLGGEEFGVVMPVVSAETASVVAARLRACVADEPVRTADHLLWVTVSIGTSMLQPCDNGIDTVLARADMALYQAKRAGRNCIHSSEPVLLETAER